MNKIDIQLKKIKESGKIGLMTHVVVGYPKKEMTLPLIEALVACGSDFIELQIPFSDPIADGPTIMHASDVALQSGITVDDAFNIMKEASEKVEVPLLFMGYYNTILNYGVDKFCQRTKECGGSGLIFPDLPPEEESREHLLECARKHDLQLIRVISPASSDERLKANAEIAEGFVYCISRFGVTGSASELDSRLSEYLTRVRKYFKIPVAVGFGISKPEQSKALAEVAEVAIVGSAIIEIIEKYSTDREKMLNEVKKFIASLK